MANPSSTARACTDPIVGAILAGWRYDVSSITPEMRTEYDHHLEECTCCQRRQFRARTIDVLLLCSFVLSVVVFLLAAIVLHRFELWMHMSDLTAYHMHVHHKAIMISLEAVALTGIVVSAVLAVLVAIATPLPGLISGAVQGRLPSDLRQRLARRHA